MDKSSYKLGPEINNNIVSWLNKNSNIAIQLPIGIVVTGIGVKNSYINGTDPNIEIFINTTSISSDFPSLVRSICTDYPCYVWLEGNWSTLNNGDKRPTFFVRNIVEPAHESDIFVRIIQQK